VSTRRLALLGVALLLLALDGATGAAPRSAGKPAPRHYRAIVALPTFMEHVLSPAAEIVWRASGTVSDAAGEHDLTPKSDAEWEQVVSGAATLAEATNALIIPPRARDPVWYSLAGALADAATQAYQAAEAHDGAAIAQAGARIDAACTSCHKYYGLE
jgi:hypothetical protein